MITHHGFLPPTTLIKRLIQAAAGNASVDQHRLCELSGRGIDDGVSTDDSRATGEVARALSVIAAGSAPLSPNLRGLASGRSRLTGKTLEWF